MNTERIIGRAGEHNVYKPKTILRRPLDGQEDIFYEYYKRNISCATTCALIKSKIPLKEETVRQALSMLCQRQTLLRATVVEASDGKTRHFESASGVVDHKINFCTLDRDVDERLAVWENLISEMDFERDEGCLWRAVLLREKFDKDENCFYNALALLVCHSIIDAAGMFSLYQQLLAYIEAITKGESIKLTDIQELPFLPSQSSLVSHKVKKVEKHVAFAAAGDTPATINPVLACFPKSQSTELSPHTVTKVMLREISWPVLEKLVTACRNHGSTLTGALAAVCHIAFSSLLNTRLLRSDLTNDISCYVDTSKHSYIPLPADLITYTAAPLTYNLPLPAVYKDLWELASQFTTQFHSDIANLKHLRSILMVNENAQQMLENTLAQAKLPMALRRQSNHRLANTIPVFTRDDPKRMFSLHDMFGGSPTHGRDPTFKNYLTTTNGHMNWITVYDNSLISAQVANTYYDSMTGLLNKILNCDNNALE